MASTNFEIVGGVDPNNSIDDVAPCFPTLDAAFDEWVDPNLVVVATPTETHVALVSELLERCSAMVLSEKPLAIDVGDIKQLEHAHGQEVVASRVRVSHHFAFSPEVEWARRVVQTHPEWGSPTEILCVSNDAYAGLPPSRLAGYVSSWIDSGPNQLSVVASFAAGWRVISHERKVSRSVTVIEHTGGRAVLCSNWLAGDTSKQTSLVFGESGVQLRMDHTSMTGLIIRNGEVQEHLSYEGAASRKFAHYAGLYRALLSNPTDPRLGVQLAKDIAAVLQNGEQSLRTNTTTWSTTTATGNAAD